MQRPASKKVVRAMGVEIISHRGGWHQGAMALLIGLVHTIQESRLSNQARLQIIL